MININYIYRLNDMEQKLQLIYNFKTNFDINEIKYCVLNLNLATQNRY